MKKNLFFTMLTFMMVAMFGFTLTSCGDGDGGSGGSLEGTWRITSAKWSHYTKGGSIETDGDTRTYDETTTEGLTITYSDGKYTIFATSPGMSGTFEQVGTNEYKRDDQRVVIKGISGNTLTVEFYEDYYRNADGKRDEYGLLTFQRVGSSSNDNSNIPNWFVGEWQECDNYGNTKTGNNIDLWVFNSDGTGRFWSGSYQYTFNYVVYSYSDNVIKIKKTYTSSSVSGDVGYTENQRFSYNDGILQRDAYFYKKVTK